MVRSVLTVLLVLTLTVCGCGRSVDGVATRGPLAVDPSFFFAGELPVYGQTVSNSDRVALAYRRAIRRIDVCGLVNPDALAKIGEVGSLSTLFAFDECDAEVKLPGRPDPRFVTVQLDMTRTDSPVAFRVGNAPVYETSTGSCDFLTPLDLGRLPAAAGCAARSAVPAGRADRRADCGLTKKVVGAITAWLTGAPLPPRDSAAGYPVALAERDPCEVLSVLAGDVDRWDISSSRPYQCEFGVWRDGDPEVVSMRLALEPKIVDLVTAALNTGSSTVRTSIWTTRSVPRRYSSGRRCSAGCPAASSSTSPTWWCGPRWWSTAEPATVSRWSMWPVRRPGCSVSRGRTTFSPQNRKKGGEKVVLGVAAATPANRGRRSPTGTGSAARPGRPARARPRRRSAASRPAATGTPSGCGCSP